MKESDFMTSEHLETKGMIVDYGEFRVTLARAGGSNKRYLQRMAAATKPYRRLIENNQMDQKKLQDLTIEVFADTVILLWEVKDPASDQDESWKPGINMPGEGFKRIHVCQCSKDV